MARTPRTPQEASQHVLELFEDLELPPRERRQRWPFWKRLLWAVLFLLSMIWALPWLALAMLTIWFGIGLLPWGIGVLPFYYLIQWRFVDKEEGF